MESDGNRSRTHPPRWPYGRVREGRWVESLDWTFGDDTTGTGWWNTHRYDSAGAYTVRLTATDNTDRSTTDEVTISVADLETPIARPDPSTTDASVDERITFSVGDTSGDDRWVQSSDWMFIDGTTGTGWWNAHRYDSTGTCTVTLTSTDNTDHSTTFEVIITVA